MTRLADKVALITGAGSGIGLATAELLAREGARVVLVGRNEQALTAAATRIGNEQATAVVADVARPEDNARMVQTAVERFGGLDIFIANAGVEGVTTPIENYPIEVFDQVMAVNVRGVFLGLKFAIPALRQRGGGSIVITSSIGGIRGRGQGNSAYITSKHAENGFAFQFPPVPIRQFLHERDLAFDPTSPTRPIALDSSDALGTDYPATTPTILCRCLKLRAGEKLLTQYVASGEICYVMSGTGESRNGDDRIGWTAGDVFCFPGGDESAHRAMGQDALLFCVTNEPLLAFERLRAPEPGTARVEATHWPAAVIDGHFEAVWRRPMTADTTGYSVQFTSQALAPSINTIPSVNCSINTLAAGSDQRPHRHDGVAVTLAIQGEGVHSMIDGQRVAWSTGAAQITPATLMHSHHARGGQRMRSFVIQDEGLHFYTRTPGFGFD